MNKPERSLESYKARHLDTHRLEADGTTNSDQPTMDSASAGYSNKPGNALRRWAAAVILFAALVVTTLFISQTFKNTSETAIYQALHTPWGLFTQNPPINRPAYVMEFDDDRGLLRWVSFKVQPGKERSQPDKQTDPNIRIEGQRARQLTKQASGDYQCAGLISPTLVQDDPETLETIHYYSVYAPQTQNLDKSLMRQLDNRAKKRTSQSNPAWVILGPIYLRDEKAANLVGIPSHFFYIIVSQPPAQKPIIDAYILPQQGTEKDISKFERSLEEVERHSGLKISILDNWDPS